MDAMTLFMLVLLGMTFPIVAILGAVFFDVAVMAWMAIDAAFRGLTHFGHTIRVLWIHAAHP